MFNSPVGRIPLIIALIYFGQWQRNSQWPWYCIFFCVAREHLAAHQVYIVSKIAFLERYSFIYNQKLSTGGSRCRIANSSHCMLTPECIVWAMVLLPSVISQLATLRYLRKARYIKGVFHTISFVALLFPIY